MTDVDIASLLKNFAQDIKDDLKKEIQANADISIRNHEETRKRLDSFGRDLHSVDKKVDVLWRKVHGPNVPPPKTSGEYRLHLDKQAKEGSKPLADLAESVSDHDLRIEGLQADMKVLTEQVKTSEAAARQAKDAADKAKDEAASAKGAVGEVKEIAEEVLAMNRMQNQNLGIGVSLRGIGEFFQWLKTKQGQRYVATMFAAATSLVTALGTTYALLTKRLPAPTDPVPTTAHTVYVPVPVPAPSHGSPAPHP